MGYVPSHNDWCVKVRSFPTFCRDCYRRVIYFECSCGSRVLLDPPREGRHEDSCPGPCAPFGRGNCRLCGRPLTKLESIKRGMGPDCWDSDHKHKMVQKTIPDGGVNATNEDGVTQLHLLARRAARVVGDGNALNACKELGNWLSNSGVKVNAQDVWGETPLHYGVAESADPEGVIDALVIGEAADVNVSDNNGNTPAHAAAAKVVLRAMTKLANHGAEMSVRNEYGETPLHLAVRAEAAKIVKYEPSGIVATADMAKVVDCSKGAVSVPDKFGITPLHYALSKTTIKKLVDCGADVNARDDWERTPLHYAVERGSGEAVSTLRALGADINARNQQGDSPLDIAEKSGNKEIAELLRQK